ncbi:lipopolysaccharide biosynthesis protein [Mammaliicoccus sciuri]|uniref:lipopolysaccharide biosynthesis protein n=1 Tax=Mammaliicoccus sciuri TaxID=1296 RepID=UPI0019525CB4|nr:hypothetical protein [Mammaliicoccus sciuri]
MVRKFIKDTSINIMSNLLLVCVIQLICFPLLNKSESENVFSLITVVYGYAIIIATTLGNTLNNVRLLYNNKIEQTNKEYLFNNIFKYVIISNIIIFSLLIWLYTKEVTVNNILIVFFSVLLTSRYYLNVYFREKLNFNKILYSNIYILIGYLIGILSYITILDYYSVIFVMGELLGIIYIIYNFKDNNYKYESDKKIESDIKGKVYKDYVNYALTNFMINVLNYLDRILVFPLVGANAITTYFIGSTTSKMISLITTPMNNVLLSYITIDESKNNYFKTLNLLALTSLIPCFFLIKYNSLLLTKILYNDYFEHVDKIINLVTVICLLSIYNSVINPFCMKILSSITLLKIQIIYAGFYIISALFFTINYGLHGFCWATIISILFRLIVTNFKIYIEMNRKGL